MKLILLFGPKERCEITKITQIIWPESFVEIHDVKMQKKIPENKNGEM